MGIMDAFSPEDRVSVKFSDFYALMRDSTKVEFMENAINCNVPHRYIRDRKGRGGTRNGGKPEWGLKNKHRSILRFGWTIGGWPCAVKT